MTGQISASTYNIYYALDEDTGHSYKDWNIRKNKIVDLIDNKASTDVVFLQETTDIQFEYLSEMLEKYLVLRGNKNDLESRNQCILLKKTIFDEKSIDVISLPLLDNQKKASVTILKVQDLHKKIFIFASVHLDAGDDSQEDRLVQIKNLQTLLSEYNDKYTNPTIIFGGDFNSLPSNEVIDIISQNFTPIILSKRTENHTGPKHTFQSWPLTKSIKIAAFIGKILNLFQKCCCCSKDTCCSGPTGRQIDFIFHNSTVTLNSTQVHIAEDGAPQSSDHLPTSAIFNILN